MTILQDACTAIDASNKTSRLHNATGAEAKALRIALGALLAHNRDLEERMTKLTWRVGVLEHGFERVDEWMKDRP